MLRQLKITKTENGLRRIEFTDQTGRECNLQEYQPGVILFGLEPDRRMALSVANLQSIIPILKKFIKTGRLPEKVAPQ